jgi:pyruvate dehydrogenase E2 component (dihydrolipoamide acetyltransferase)
MAADIIMPKLGLTMEEGTIVRWHAAAGERVAQGRPLLEVETDKVTVEVEAPATGVMGTLLVGKGQKVPVGTLLGLIAGTEEEILRFAQDDNVQHQNDGIPHQNDNEGHQNDSTHRSEAAAPSRPRISPLARRMAGQAGVDLTAVAPGGPGGRITAGDVQAVAESHPSPGPEPAHGSDRARRFSSPRARRQARALGVDWRALLGTGPRGRVIERDVLRVAIASPLISSPTLPPSIPPARGEGVRWETPTAAQRVSAERMTISFRSAPHFYLDVEVQADALLELRDRLLPTVERKADVRLTVTDLLVRIAGVALAEHSRANAFWADGRVGLHDRVNVGIAVATSASAQLNTEASTLVSPNTGLIVPVLRDVDRKPLAQIAVERAALVERARAGQLSPDDLAGGTFTLTNLGMYRVDSFHAILNPPQSAILAVGRIAERPIAIGGQLAVRRTVVLTLSCDHRVLDGVLGARFLGRVAELIEDPYELLV